MDSLLVPYSKYAMSKIISPMYYMVTKVHVLVASQRLTLETWAHLHSDITSKKEKILQSKEKKENSHVM